MSFLFGKVLFNLETIFLKVVVAKTFLVAAYLVPFQINWKCIFFNTT